jgi:hypothetical protein
MGVYVVRDLDLTAEAAIDKRRNSVADPLSMSEINDAIGFQRYQVSSPTPLHDNLEGTVVKAPFLLDQKLGVSIR